MIDIFSRVEIEVLELIFNSMGLGNDDLIEMCKGILKMDSLNEFKLELRNTKVTEKSA